MTGEYFRKGWWPDKQLRPRSDLLIQFCRIAESPNTEKAATAFVKRWGLLGLCEHGLPTIHNQKCAVPDDSASGYKKFAVCLDALGRIGLDLGTGRPGTDLDWELAEQALFAEDFAVPSPAERATYKNDIDTAREKFATLIGRLTVLTQLHPRLHWDRKASAWAIDFDSFARSNLPALLTIQLMAYVGGNVMKKCRNCPRWFQARGRQVYCKECGIRAAWRAAARKSRQKPILTDSSGGRKKQTKKRER
jgi:hypothetical protein